MRIVSIEPTPSPHSMKINLNKELPADEKLNYKLSDDLSNAPDYIKSLFEIDGVKGIYQVIDFIALERNPRVPWEIILPKVRMALGTEEAANEIATTENSQTSVDNFGEVKVFIQMFRGIPMQVKLDDGDAEKRFGLSKIFSEAIMAASDSSPNIVMERAWVEQRPRYGSVDEIGNDVVEELSASYDQARLDALVKQAYAQGENSIEAIAEADQHMTLDILAEPDWKVRYAAMDRLKPTFAHIDILEKALQDEKASIRRLATAYLGMLEEPEVLPYLYIALKDKAVTVRRTAGDCLSDLGFIEAMPEMIASLADENRLVRWRAAMFLYELGDEHAIPALENALNEPEFEVKMQIKMALERIQGGEAAKGSVWHQMTEATKLKK